MHEHAIGLPQDFDLAKRYARSLPLPTNSHIYNSLIVKAIYIGDRYYDQALNTEEAAVVPVKLALVRATTLYLPLLP